MRVWRTRSSVSRKERCVGPPVIAPAVLLLLDAEDIGGAAVGGEQIGAVLALEKVPECSHPRPHAHQVVLIASRENGFHQIVTHALLSQVHLDSVSNEGKQPIVGRFGSRFLRQRVAVAGECCHQRVVKR